MVFALFNTYEAWNWTQRRNLLRHYDVIIRRGDLDPLPHRVTVITQLLWWFYEKSDRKDSIEYADLMDEGLMYQCHDICFECLSATEFLCKDDEVVLCVSLIAVPLMKLISLILCLRHISFMWGADIEDCCWKKMTTYQQGGRKTWSKMQWYFELKATEEPKYRPVRSHPILRPHRIGTKIQVHLSISAWMMSSEINKWSIRSRWNDWYFFHLHGNSSESAFSFFERSGWSDKDRTN